jgi:hypothetical protein
LYLAGDSFHHPSALRPNEFPQLPHELYLPAFGPKPCPCQVFRHIEPEKLLDEPFAKPSDSFSHNNEQAIETISKIIQPFDADDRCLVIAAHDESPYLSLEYVPKQAICGGQKAGR